MRGRNSTLSNSCAMRLPTSFRHHRANRSLRTSTKLNDVQPKLFRAARQDDHRVCVYRVRHGRECRFRQAACLTIAQRFSALVINGNGALAFDVGFTLQHQTFVRQFGTSVSSQQATTCAAAIIASRLPGRRAVGTILKSPRSETVAPRLSIFFFLLYPSSIITIRALRLCSIAHSEGQKCEWQVQPIVNRL
jgi:hypothetical protein